MLLPMKQALMRPAVAITTITLVADLARAMIHSLPFDVMR